MIYIKCILNEPMLTAKNHSTNTIFLLTWRSKCNSLLFVFSRSSRSRKGQAGPALWPRTHAPPSLMGRSLVADCSLKQSRGKLSEEMPRQTQRRLSVTQWPEKHQATIFGDSCGPFHTTFLSESFRVCFPPKVLFLITLLNHTNKELKYVPSYLLKKIIISLLAQICAPYSCLPILLRIPFSFRIESGNELEDRSLKAGLLALLLKAVT